MKIQLTLKNKNKKNLKEQQLERQNQINQKITQSLKESFEKTPFGQIVADEVNYVVGNLPEVRLAMEVLGEQAIKEDVAGFARAVMTLVKKELENLVPGMVRKAADELKADNEKDLAKVAASIETEEPAA